MTELAGVDCAGCDRFEARVAEAEKIKELARS